MAVDRVAATARMARLFLNHFEAGHDLDNPKMVTDLRTLRRNADAVLDTIPPYPATAAEQRAFMIRELVAQRATHKEFLMSLATDIAAAAAETGRSATAAAERVVTAIGTVRTDLAAAVAEIERLIAAGPTPEDTAALQAALADIQAADAVVDSIEAAPAPEPTPEEPSTPEEPFV